MPAPSNIPDLINKYLDGTATPEEKLLLEQWHATLLLEKQVYSDIPGLPAMQAASWEQLHAILQEESTPAPVHRIHFLRTAWLRYAAAILILLITAAYLWTTQYQKDTPSVAETKSVPVNNDVAPGGNRAILKLADGSTVVLDTAQKGLIARQGQTNIRKTAEGSLVYEIKGGANDPEVVLTNTVSTPRGGQYQVLLPDGTSVWLNAESSITYPSAFTGEERTVTITGEVYFEVARKTQQPFIVQTAHQTIEVLGTHFNVNAYPNETTINTTLLEGSVRIKTVHTSLATPATDSSPVAFLFLSP